MELPTLNKETFTLPWHYFSKENLFPSFTLVNIAQGNSNFFVNMLKKYLNCAMGHGRSNGIENVKREQTMF